MVAARAAGTEESPTGLRYTAPPMALAPRTRLSIHDIVSPLGARGVGEAYLAHDTQLEREVAIRALPQGSDVRGR